MPSYSISQFFRPTDQEIVGLILHDLLVENQPLAQPLDAIIRRFNPFGSKLEPAEIWEMYGGDQLVDQDVYFLADLKAKKRARFNRKVGSNGTWSQGEVAKPVEVRGNPNPIGLKRKFRFEDKKSKKQNENGAWFIDEYSLFDGPKNPDDYKNYDFDFVICRMRRNARVPEAAPKTLKRKSAFHDQIQSIETELIHQNPRKKMRKDYESYDDDGHDDDHAVEGSSSQTMDKVAVDDHNVIVEEDQMEHLTPNTTSFDVECGSEVKGLIPDDVANIIASYHQMDTESFEKFVANPSFDLDDDLDDFFAGKQLPMLDDFCAGMQLPMLDSGLEDGPVEETCCNSSIFDQPLCSNDTFSFIEAMLADREESYHDVDQI